jgi:iron complex outermembrane recepter protein
MLSLTRFSRLIAAGIMFGFISTMVFAQTNESPDESQVKKPPGKTTAPETALQEVIVTAQRRTESERTIPISITALSGDAISAEHINDFMDLSRAVPGLSVTTQGAPGLNNLEIRGVSSQAGGSTVAVYLDETPVSTPHVQAAFVGTTEPDFVDIDRVEVLRGPQGTLYGSSSEGGTVRFISRQPSLDTFDADGDADLSGTDHGGFNYRATTAVNFPLVTGVSGVRVAAMYGHSDGWIDQLSQSDQIIARGVNDQEDAAFRLTWAIQPTESFRITPAVYVQRTTTGDTSIFFDSLGPYEEAKYVKEPLRDQLVLPTVTVTLQSGSVAFTSISSFLVRDLQHQQDGTLENSQYFGAIAGAPPPIGFGFGGNVLDSLPSPISARTVVRQWSQELRIASRGLEESGDRFSWVAGVYLSDQRLTYAEDDLIPGFSSTFQSLFGVSAESFFGAPFPNDDVYTVRSKYDERQYAAFGDLTFKLTDSLRFSTGLRYLIAREAADLFSGDYFGTGLQDDISHEHAQTPRFALTYIASPETTLYASASKGFRLGGGNSAIPVSLCAHDLANIGLTAAPLTYNSDSLWNYEMGTKLLLFDNRVSVDADIYYLRWNDIQQDIYLPTCVYFFEANVGDARSYGSEIGIKANATPHLTLSVSGGTTDATITENVKALNVMAGAHILGVPEWSANLGAMLHGKASSVDDLFMRADYLLTGPSSGTFDPTQVDFRRPAYQVLNLSAGAERHGMKFTVYAQNALNDTKAIQHINNNGLIEAFGLRPLTIGITISKSLSP